MENKKRAIYADDLTSALRDDLNINGKNFARVKRHIENAPTVDAVEVVHGQWEWKPLNDTTWQLRCSVCGSEDGANETYHYCPNCGAKMDGGNDNGC